MGEELFNMLADTLLVGVKGRVQDFAYDFKGLRNSN